MTQKQRAEILTQVSQEALDFFQKRLLRKGAMGPSDAVEGSFQIVPRLTIKVVDSATSTPALTPAQVTASEWETMLLPVEGEIPFKAYTGRDDKLTGYHVADIQRGLKKLQKNNNQPCRYAIILLDGRNIGQVNGFLAHLKLDLMMRTFGIKIVGKLSRIERKVNHVILVRRSVEVNG